MTDYSDSDKKIELILTDMLTETPKLYLNGTLQDSTVKFQDSEYRSGKYAGEENRTFVFLYDNLLGKFFGENNIELLTPQTYADGNRFEGFSGGVYVDIVCGEVDAQSLFVLNMLSNQSFNAASFPNDSELQGPEIYTGIAGETVTSINSVFSVPEVQAFDVLQHSATCTINIYDPDNRHIVHNLKMDGEYLLALTKYGVYRIEYNAVDYIGNVTRKTLTIVVKDEIAPEIEMKGEILPTYKLNEELHVPEVTVWDNTDAEVKVQLLIRTPDRGFKTVNSGETFALAAKGKYEFIVYAMDASGNLLYKSFPFEVQ